MGKIKLPEVPDDSNFELRICKGQQEFFVKGSPRGLVFGSCNEELKAGRDDRLTFGVNQESEFAQVHRKIDNKEVWRHTEHSIRAEFQRFWVSHSEEIDGNLLNQPNTRILSSNRLNVAFSLLSLAPRIWMTIFGRFIQNHKIIRANERKFRIMLGIDQQKAIRLLGAFAFPVGLVVRMVGLIPHGVRLKMLRWLFSLFVINPQDSHRLIDDMGILLAPNKSGLLKMSKDKKLSFISFTALDEMKQTVENNLPLGKLSELTNFSDLSTIELSVKKSQEPSRT